MMIVMKNKSTLDSIERFHDHLYDMADENYELLEIYKDIDEEVAELESRLDYIENEFSCVNEDIDEMKDGIKSLLKRVEKWKKFDESKKDVIIEDLKRILF